MGEIRSNSSSSSSRHHHHHHIGTKRSIIFLLISILSILSWFLIFSSSNPNRVLDYISDAQQSKQAPPLTNNSNQENIQHTKTEDNIVQKTLGSCIKGKKVISSYRALRVYMYDMKPEFHFGLLGWEQEQEDEERNGVVVWPDVINNVNVPHHPGGLNLQHSVEYWLTLDLLLSDKKNILQEEEEDSSRRRSTRAVIRVRNSSEADVIFVPFFSSLSYNRFSKVGPKMKKSRDRELQEEVVSFVRVQKEWKKTGGKDHIIMAHHPNSMSTARHKLSPAMFVVSDFGRYSPLVANIDKDIVAPYKHLVPSYVNDTLGFDDRPILLYFQGAIHRKAGGFVRQELYNLLKEEKDVHFSFGNVQNHGITKAGQGMRSSKFCLNIAGDTPSSNRLFDAIASHCIPLIISDEIELPYEDVLNYNEFCLFVRSSDALKKGFVLDLVKSIERDEWDKMWRRLKEVEKYFELRFPAREGDGVEMIWRAIARKASFVKLKVHKHQRFIRPYQHI